MNQLIAPSSNFQRVRDGRNAPDAYVDIDLSVVSDQSINIAGNAFFADANPLDGNCIVFFQETDNLRGPTPFYVSPGFIARVPFTQIRVVNNNAQIGKKIRLIYGVDIDFQPGSVSQVTFAGKVDLNGATYNASFIASALVANSNTIIAPASNVNGIVLSNLDISYNTTAGGVGSILAKTSAPISLTDGDGIGIMHQLVTGAMGVFDYKLINPLFLPPGKGLYLYTATGTAYASQQQMSATWQQ